MLKSGLWSKAQNGRKSKGDPQKDGLELDNAVGGGEDGENDEDDSAVETIEAADRGEVGGSNGQSGGGLWTGLQKGLQIKLDSLSLDKTFCLDAKASHGDVLFFLDDVLGHSNDDSTQQARDAILAEGIKSLAELKQVGTSVATLVEMGVPLPQARKLHSALEDLNLDEGDDTSEPPQLDTTERSNNPPAQSKSSSFQRGRASTARRASAPENTRSAATAYRTRSERCSLGAEEEEDAPVLADGDGDGMELEVTPQLREWLEGRGLGACTPALLAQKLSDFSAMWASSEGDFVALGIPPDAAAKLVEEVAARHGTEAAALEQARCAGVGKAGQALWGGGLGLASKAGLAVSAWSCLIARHLSAQAEDVATARAFGLCFDEALTGPDFRLDAVDGGGVVDSVVSKVSFSHAPSTAVAVSLRKGCEVHSVEFVVRALSRGGLVRLGFMEEGACASLSLSAESSAPAPTMVGDDSRSWALSSGGHLVHRGKRVGPPLGLALSAGDRVRLVIYEAQHAARFGVNGKMLGVRLEGVVGPVVPALSVAAGSKCVVQLDDYWAY